MNDHDSQFTARTAHSRRLWRRLVWASVMTVTLVVGVVVYRAWHRDKAIRNIEQAGGMVFVKRSPTNWIYQQFHNRRIRGFDSVNEVLNIHQQTFAELSVLRDDPIAKLSFRKVQFPTSELSFLSRMDSLREIDIGMDVQLSEQAMVELGQNHTLKKLTLSDRALIASHSHADRQANEILGINRRRTREKLENNFLAGSSESLKHLNHLKVLEIQKRILSENDLHSISQLKALRELKLIDCRLPEEGMKSLAELSKLRYLGLNDSPVTSGQLLELQSLPKLEQLHLPGTELSKEEMEQVKAAFEHCKVTGTYGSNSTEEKSEPLHLKLITK